MTALATAARQVGGTIGRLDRVGLATAGILAVLAVAAPAQGWSSLVFTVDSLIFIAPFLIV